MAIKRGKNLVDYKSTKRKGIVCIRRQPLHLHNNIVTRNWYENIGFITIMYILGVLRDSFTVINISLSCKENFLPAIKAFCLKSLYFNSRQSSLRSSWKIMTKCKVCQCVVKRRPQAAHVAAAIFLMQAGLYHTVVCFAVTLGLAYSTNSSISTGHAPEKSNKIPQGHYHSKSLFIIMVSIQLCGGL